MQMMGVKEYAEKMSASASQIRQMCADGILPSVKIGKGYKIDVERADEYFNKAIESRLTATKPAKKAVRVTKTAKASDFVNKLKQIRSELKYEQEQVC